MSARTVADSQGEALPVSKTDSRRALPAHGMADPRILIIDDNRGIHEDFRKVLAAVSKLELDEVEATLFESPEAHCSQLHFILDSAYQGQDGLELVRRSLKDGHRYALAFVDFRMPPGWDGIETISRLWGVDPDLQVVLCTAHSDYSWGEIVKHLGHTDSLLILKKPFDTAEVMQLAHALTRKWFLLQQSRWRLEDLDNAVTRRTRALRALNKKLVQEIAEHKRSEEALRISEERFRSIWEHSADGMRLTDRDGRIVAVNEAFCQLVKLPREKLVGQVFSVMYKGHGPDDGIEVYHRRFDTGALVPRLTARVQFWNAEEVDLEISSSFIDRGAEGRMVLNIFRDVTERKQLEVQLRQSQKMEAIGQLAGGVAHDFNNLLAVIRGNAELALMRDEQLPSPAGECLKQVVSASDRAAKLTRQLLAFSRKQVMQSQPLDLNEVIGNLTKMLKRIIGEDIQLQCGYAARLPFVQADVGMLEQVLVNLVVNARDAMPKGGQLLLSTDKLSIPAGGAKSHPEARPGDFVCLRVSDSGVGIPPENLARIFEPFFTTKEVGKGTGLGLATVYGIVKQHQGWIEVTSKVGSGTTFSICLPAIEAPASATKTESAQPRPRGGSETILLVEDDEAVRLMTRRLLENHGYRLLEAASGSEALKVWRNRMEDIHLLLTDVVMPNGVGGRELAEQLLAERPNLKLILMSGYSGDTFGKDTTFICRSKGRFLQKPCNWRDLLQTVRQTLDGQ